MLPRLDRTLEPMPRYVVRAMRGRTVHELRVVARLPEQAYNRARDELERAGVTVSGLVFVVFRRGLFARLHFYPFASPTARPGRRGDGGGLAGVREPRRPKPGAPSSSIAMDEPGESGS